MNPLPFVITSAVLILFDILVLMPSLRSQFGLRGWASPASKLNVFFLVLVIVLTGRIPESIAFVLGTILAVSCAETLRSHLQLSTSRP